MRSRTVNKQGAFLRLAQLRPNARTVAAVLCISVLAVVYATEFVIAAMNAGFGIGSTALWSMDAASTADKKSIAAVARGVGAEIDIRDRVDILDGLRARGIQAVPAVMLGGLVSGAATLDSADSTTHELMPLGGISNAPTVLCNESGQYVIYDSDEHGFRNPTGIWQSARADMAVVGESFAQGYCVPDGQSFVDLLRARYPVTLNLGISGGAPLLQLAAIREYLPRYAPKWVLWVFSEGIDLADMPGEVKHPWLIRYLEPSFGQHLLSRQHEIDDALRRHTHAEEMRWRQRRSSRREATFTEKWAGRIKLWGLREKVQLASGIPRTDPPPPVLTVFSESLTQAQTVTRSWGGTLYFVYLPSWNRFRNGSRGAERERTAVLQLVNGLGIPTIDVQPAFEAHEDPLSLFPFRRFGHYNERGNQIVARALLTFLSTHPGERSDSGDAQRASSQSVSGR
jgi:hypothetical protein